MKHGMSRAVGRHRVAAALLVAVALALEFSSACGIADAPRPQRSGPAHGVRIVGYVVGSQAPISVDTEKVTALNYAFAHIRDGEAALDDANAQEFVQRLRSLRFDSPWLQVLISIGGWGADGF